MSYDDPYGDMGDPGANAPRGSSRRQQGQSSGGGRAPRRSNAPDLGSYVEVKDRITAFYAKYPEGRIQSEIVTGISIIQEVEVEERTRGNGKQYLQPHGVGFIAVKASAYRTPDDPLPATGHSGMFLPGSTDYTFGSELENAETSAWGRALANLDILNTGGIASRDEVRKARSEPDEDDRAAEAYAAAQAASSSPSGGPSLDVSAPGAPETATDTPAATGANGEAPPAAMPPLSEEAFVKVVKDHFIGSAIVNSTRIRMFPESRSYKELSGEERAVLAGVLMADLEASQEANRAES